MVHPVKKHLHVKPKFSGFDVSHLNEKAVANAKHAHHLSEGSKAHKATVKNLKEIDKRLKQHYPQLNVSLSKKYLTTIRLAEGLGGCDDGDIPVKVVNNYLKKQRGKK